MKYKWKAMDDTGVEKKGVSEADNRNILEKELKDRGLFPTDITEIRDKNFSYGTIQKHKKMEFDRKITIIVIGVLLSITLCFCLYQLFLLCFR